MDTEKYIAGLQSNDDAARVAAAEKLAQSESAALAAAVELVRATGDPTEAVRENAVAALEEMGAPSEDQIGRLIELVGQSSPEISYWAITLIGRLGPRAKPSTAALATALSAECDVSVRQRAAWALGKIGNAAAAARPQLEIAAADTDPRLARLASQALIAVKE